MTEADAEDVLHALGQWRAKGQSVWHPHMIAVWDRAMIAVNELKVKLHLEHEAPMPDRAIVKSFALLSTVLTDGEGTRFLVVDALGGKVTLVRVPDGLQPGDYGAKFWHAPVPWDPARATLERE